MQGDDLAAHVSVKGEGNAASDDAVTVDRCNTLLLVRVKHRQQMLEIRKAGWLGSAQTLRVAIEETDLVGRRKGDYGFVDIVDDGGKLCRLQFLTLFRLNDAHRLL